MPRFAANLTMLVEPGVTTLQVAEAAAAVGEDEGVDAAHKLALLTCLAFGTRISIDEIHCEGIEHIRRADIEAADELGYHIKLLGVASPKRLATMPEIPTLQEQGIKGFEGYAWQGLVVPTGTPRPVHLDMAGYTGDALTATEGDFDLTVDDAHTRFPAFRPAPDPAAVERAVAAIKASSGDVDNKVRKLREALAGRGFAARAYHAGLDAAERVTPNI
mgnify:CR=1 FL=1